MDNPRPEKVAVVAEVRDRLSSSGATILTEYRGLKVAELAALRRSVRQAGGDYRIYKNTLVRFAVRDLGLDGMEELLTGPTALTFVDGDPVEVARALRDYARANPALVLKGGILGTAALSADQTRALAEVPPRAVLLARLAGGLAAPLQHFAGLLQALPRNLAFGLRALIDQRSAGEGAGEAPPEPATSDDAAPATDEPAPATDAVPATDEPAPATDAVPATDEPAPAADHATTNDDAATNDGATDDKTSQEGE